MHLLFLEHPALVHQKCIMSGKSSMEQLNLLKHGQAYPAKERKAYQEGIRRQELRKGE